MAQREGSIYLWLFVASFVLFVGMVVCFFVENANKNKVTGELAKAKGDHKSAEERAKKNAKERDDLRELVAGPAVAAAWPSVDNEPFKQQLKDTESFINDQFKKLSPEQRAPKSYNYLVDPFTDYKDLVGKIYESQLKASESHKRGEEDRKQWQQANKKDVESRDALVATLRTQVSETETRYEKKISELTRDGERLQKELATSKDEMASAEIRHNRQIQFLESTIASLRLRLDQLMEESRKTRTIEDVEPDGKVLQVASQSQIGWLDIGRKNYLRPGLEFRVFQNVKGGKRQYKGMIEVRRVDETVSEFRIVDTDDELNPITQGDLVTSPFYDPKAAPVFVIAGAGLESKDVTEEALRQKIVSYGAEIRNDVDLKTSFLIALKDYEKSPLYKAARDLGVAVVREREILQYMGL